jgi:hypothetical protein
MLPSEIADKHLQARTRLVSAGTQKSLRIWSRMDVSSLDRSWDRLAPTLVATVTAAQVTAAGQSGPYLDRVASYYGGAPSAELVPQAFGGVMNDGRDVGSAMFGAVTATKQRIAAGRAPAESFRVGAAFLATILQTAIADAGRNADGVLSTARSYTRYVRVLSPGACSRCAVLAGVGDYSKPFLRHPSCKCQSFPVESGKVPDGFFDNGEDYFLSLSGAEQNRVFTNAGAQAIRDGAQIPKVVNARRGYFGSATPGAAPRRLTPTVIGRKPDGSPLRVFTTSEGTSARGQFARSAGGNRLTSSVRLMPESIYKMSSDPVRVRELLQQYGYIN